MHLNYYLLSLVGLAINVVNQRPVFLKQCRLLLVEECQVDDVLLSLKQAVEEVEQQRFRQLLSEDSLETDIGERINVFCHISQFLLAKIVIFIEMAIKRMKMLQIING